MDQLVNTTDLAALAKTPAGLMAMAGKNNKITGVADGQFQKLLEQHAKPAEKPNASQPQDQDAAKQPTDSTTEKSEAAEGTADSEKPVIGIKEKPGREDPLEQAKRLAEMGATFYLPEADDVWIDADLEAGEVYGIFSPKEYIIGKTTNLTENILTAGLDDQQMEQLHQIVGDLRRVSGAEDPRADAMLEATDPTVEHGPAQLLEKVVAEQTGEVVEQAAEKVLNPQEDDGIQTELVDVGRGSEQLFHDVEAAPVKVGESFDPQLAQDVNEQIAAQIIPALQQGETRVELQLTPENLGTVKVEITQTENGSLHIAITAENSQTRNMLEKTADNLQNLLASRTQNEVRVEVQRQEESQAQHNNYDGHNSQHQQQEQQQQQHRQQSYEDSLDFLHQLRLGLVDEAEA